MEIYRPGPMRHVGYESGGIGPDEMRCCETGKQDMNRCIGTSDVPQFVMTRAVASLSSISVRALVASPMHMWKWMERFARGGWDG